MGVTRVSNPTAIGAESLSASLAESAICGPEGLLVDAMRPGSQDREAAWKEFYRRHAGRLLGFIRTIASDLGDEACDDLLAETVVKIERNIGSYEHRHEGSFHSWCVKIAQNVCISARRGKTSRIPDAELVSFEDVEFLTAGNEVTAGRVDHSAGDSDHETDNADRTEAEELFAQALASLSDVDQAVILLHYITPIPDAEIGRQLGKPIDHIRKIRYKAIKKLKRAYDRLRARSQP